MKKILFMTLIILLFSCINTKEVTVNNIISMKIGYNENEIGFISKNNIISENSLNAFYRDGFYYISDGINNKIVKLTEKGILVLVIYNPENNPFLKPTISPKNETGEEELGFIKRYCEFPISMPGYITADIDKNIYVINNHQSYKKTNDDGSVSESLILKFNNKGNLLYKLGKDGIDTTPFTFIKKMVTDQQNNLIILEQTDKGHSIYKFSSEGKLISNIKLSNEDIPLTQKEASYLADIIDIKLGYRTNEIYLTCQFVNEKSENFSIVSYETIYEKILRYSLKSKKVTKMLQKINPQYYEVSKMTSTEEASNLFNNKKKVMKPMEDLIGIDVNGNMYFSQLEMQANNLNETKQRLFIYDFSGRLKQNILISYPDNIEFSSELFLGPNGKVYSYYVKDGVIQFVEIN